MSLSNRKPISLLIIIALLSLGLCAQVFALTFEVRLVVSIPDPRAEAETLSSRVMLGTDDRATDRFDTAWDAVAIRGGMIQAYLEHPEYDQATRILWRDTQASTGLPKQWDLLIQPSRSGTPVTLSWSAQDIATLPFNAQIRLLDLEGGGEEVDMRSVSTYGYLHEDSGIPHRFRIILDWPVPQGPPKGPLPPSATPPDSAPPGMAILPDLLPPGYLRKSYSVQLEAQGPVAPYTWAIIASGSLPKGLELDSASGVIQGKPRRLGEYFLTVRLMDANGLTLEKSYTLTILRRPVPSLKP
jgi:hypothetical protein